MQVDKKKFLDSLGGPEAAKRDGPTKREPTPWNCT